MSPRRHRLSDSSIMYENLKLSEVSTVCGVSVRTLRLLIADDQLAGVTRTCRGHACLPADSVPTLQDCRRMIARRRDYHLQRAETLLARLDREIEAVRFDVAEAREHPSQELGLDLVAFGSYARRWEQSTLATVLHELDMARLRILHYDAALREILQRYAPHQSACAP